MRICLMGDARSPHIVRLGSMLARSVEHVHVVSHKPGRIPGAEVEVFKIPGPGFRNPRRWAARREHYLRGFMRDFDVVNVHFLHDWGWHPSLMSDGCFVATPWGSDIVPPPGEVGPDASTIERRRLILRHASGVQVVGPSFAESVSTFAGLSPDQVDVVPWGINLRMFDRTRFPNERDRLKIGFFKGFRAVYGAEFLIRAIPQIVKRHPDVQFDMIGDGAEYDACVALAESLGVADNITWWGTLAQWQLPAVMATWRMSVIPSLHEAFGMAAVESMAMSVPVVASHVGGLPDSVVHHETGLLVPPENPDALATAIVELIESPGFCRRLGRNGRRYAERYHDGQLCLEQQLASYAACLDRACVTV
ncbi:MAG: glycosyltransferase family 4 protein [Phycisphaerae bacterium]